MNSSKAGGKAKGFSLVEITLALGVAAFALAAIVGLLSVTLKSSKAAMDDTLVAEMTVDLVNTFRKQAFTNIPSTSKVYFDISGKRVNALDTDGLVVAMSSDAAISKGAVYECKPTVTGDTNTRSADGSFNLWRIALNFQWPAGVTNSANQKTIHADIARY